jgi:alpha-glucosidase
VDAPDSVVKRWLQPPYGLDGWRVDVANMTGRRGAQADTLEIARLLRRAAAAARPDAILVAEHAHDATGDLDQDGWQATMNYAGFTRPVWSWLRADDLGLDHFLGVPGPVPSRGGRDVVATMRAFAALTSWRTYTHGWTLLGSHDTARIRTVAGDANRVEVAAGLLLTLPGVPMIFAGDEIGLEGINGEDSRRPMPWHLPHTWDRQTLELYRTLIGLRRSSPPLRHGGLRWAHVADDALCFLRETSTERLLVVARRAAGTPLRIGGVDAVDVENVYGGAPALCAEDGSIELPGDGPTVQSGNCADCCGKGATLHYGRWSPGLMVPRCGDL